MSKTIYMIRFRVYLYRVLTIHDMLLLPSLSALLALSVCTHRSRLWFGFLNYYAEIITPKRIPDFSSPFFTRQVDPAWEGGLWETLFPARLTNGRSKSKARNDQGGLSPKNHPRAVFQLYRKIRCHTKSFLAFLKRNQPSIAQILEKNARMLYTVPTVAAGHPV